MATRGLAIDAALSAVYQPPGFQQLYEQHAETVYRAALRVTGNPADAEDVLQTVFLRLLNQPPSWLHAAYFRRAATNAAIDILRRRSARAEAPLECAGSQAAPAGSPLLKERLRRALGKLDREDAQLFLLKFVEGLSTEELSEQFGIEKATVGSRLFRIRQALKKVIEK